MKDIYEIPIPIERNHEFTEKFDAIQEAYKKLEEIQEKIDEMLKIEV